MKKEIIAERLHLLKKNVGSATLVAVTKYYGVEEIISAYESGQRHFGESKVQDLLKKAVIFSDQGISDIHWHFLGHLQSNKVKSLLGVPCLTDIHSIDSIKLLKELKKRSDWLGDQKIGLFLQMNTSLEEEKSGFSNYLSLKEAVKFHLDHLEGRTNYFLKGLMTIGKIRTDDYERDARKSFKVLIEMKEKLKKDFQLKKLELSMGMSQDYKIALEMGSDFIRIGSAIFDEEVK